MLDQDVVQAMVGKTVKDVLMTGYIDRDEGYAYDGVGTFHPFPDLFIYFVFDDGTKVRLGWLPEGIVDVEFIGSLDKGNRRVWSSDEDEDDYEYTLSSIEWQVFQSDSEVTITSVEACSDRSVRIRFMSRGSAEIRAVVFHGTSWNCIQFEPMKIAHDGTEGLVSEADVSAHLDRVLDCVLASQPSYRWYLWGGNQPKSFFQELEARSGDSYRVLCYASPARGVLKIVGRVIPSYAGLVEITSRDRDQIKDLFFSVGEMAMIRLYGFRLDSVAEEFVTTVSHDIFATGHVDGVVVETDPAYISYVVDLDSSDAEGGLYERVACGPDAGVS